MYHQNTFAVLIPCDDKNRARDAFRLHANADCYYKAAEGIAEKPTIASREPTPAPAPAPQPSEGNYDSVDHIRLTFEKKPNDPHKGFQFGTDPRSDVLLGHRGTSGVSGRHFRITVNKKLCVELHEDSTFGTAIGYDGEAKDEVRRKNTWILSFQPGKKLRWKNVEICVPEETGLAFKIEFPNHEAGRPEYLTNLRAIFEESSAALPPLDGLDIQSNPPTTAPSRPLTPRQRAIYLRDEFIGRGEFGEVRRVIDASNGKFYAAKTFYSSQYNDRKRKLDEENWLEKIRNEIAIMKENPHPNIMQVIEFRETPEPVLTMPYYPLGNLQDFTNVSAKQYVSAFRQILLGLRHLHEREIVHRDLKPANLLVAAPFTIIIADFGFSKVAKDRLLTTFCGTHVYAAPEIYYGNKNGYGLSVDVWSTGVIMLEFIFDGPTPPALPKTNRHHALQQWNTSWSEMLVKTVDDLNEDEDQVMDILIHMVRIEPGERFTVGDCLKRGCANGLFRKLHDGHIVDVDGDSEVDTLEDKNLDHTLDDGTVTEGTTTPTQPSPKEAKISTEDATRASTILDGDLWGCVNPSALELQNSPSSQLAFTDSSDSGPPARRQRTSYPASWSLTIGPSNSDSDGGFDLDGGHDRDEEGKATNLFLRTDHFTGSLQSHQSAIEDEPEKGWDGSSRGILSVSELEPEVAVPAEMASFERRVLYLNKEPSYSLGSFLPQVEGSFLAPVQPNFDHFEGTTTSSTVDDELA